MEEGLGTRNLLEELSGDGDHINCNTIKNGHSQQRRPSFDLGIPSQPLHEKGTSIPTKELPSYASINNSKGTGSPMEELPSHAPINIVTLKNGAGYSQETRPNLPLHAGKGTSRKGHSKAIRNQPGKRPFRELNPNRMEQVNKGNKNKQTEKKDNWARNLFASWRESCGIANVIDDVDILIEDMPLQEFARQLPLFFQQVMKSDGSMYPSSTIHDLLLCFGRILKDARLSRIRKTGVLEEDINIMTHPFFEEARSAATVVAHEANLSVPRDVTRVVEVLSVEDVNLCLGRLDFSKNTPNGLLFRVVLFCINFFLIRSREELHALKYKDFNFENDKFGEFVQFKQRASKNYPTDIKKSKEINKRKPVEIYRKINSEVYDTFVLFYSRLPPIANDASTDGYPLFTAAITKPQSDTWYAYNQKVGVKKLGDVAKLISEITGKKFTNKDLRHSSITVLNVCGVPDEAAMKLTGHKRAENLHQYDHSDKVQMMAMQSILSKPHDNNGKLRYFKDVYEELQQEHVDSILKSEISFKNSATTQSDAGACSTSSFVDPVAFAVQQPTNGSNVTSTTAIGVCVAPAGNDNDALMV